MDIEQIRTLLVSHVWYSVPVVNIHSTEIMFRFYRDGRGYSRYLFRGMGEKMRNIVDAHWTFEVTSSGLHVTWDDNSQSNISILLTLQTKEVWDDRSRNISHFDAVLEVGQHLFPVKSQFPTGWGRDYWGRTLREDDDIQEEGE
jgi:hypothetical protein